MLKSPRMCTLPWLKDLQHMDTVLQPHARPCTDQETSLPLKMFALGPANPT